MSPSRRREMVDRKHPKLSIVRQSLLLGVSRSSLYYRPKATSEEDLSLMREMDRQYLETAFYGSRRMKGVAGEAGDTGKPEAGAAADAHHGSAGHLPAAQHQPKVAGASGLSLPVEECQDHPSQPGVGGRHHLPALGPGIPLPGGSHGLVQSVRGGMVTVQHPGRWLLLRGAGGGSGQGQAGGVQH